MLKVKLVKEGNKLLVYSPYHPNFIERAHRLGGQWDDARGARVFDCRDEDRVRKACVEVYGTDGSVPKQLFTIQAKAIEQICVSQRCIYLAGYQIARAWSRDSGARLGDGVILLEGGIRSGGSRVNWVTIVDAESVIELKDLTPEQVELSRKAAERYGKWEILSVEEQSVSIVDFVLEDEEKFLKERLKEIKSSKVSLKDGSRLSAKLKLFSRRSA